MTPDLHPNLPTELRAIVTERQPLLPYKFQDGFDRTQAEADMPVIIFENDSLRVTVYPCYGGRLASLFDKHNHRELLYNNPVFQPGNLAVRGAWFSGGMEWNGPLLGHTPHTCDNNAAKLEHRADLACGNRVLRRKQRLVATPLASGHRVA